jgi:hypothetical protein
LPNASCDISRPDASKTPIENLRQARLWNVDQAATRRLAQGYPPGMSSMSFIVFSMSVIYPD